MPRFTTLGIWPATVARCALLILDLIRTEGTACVATLAKEAVTNERDNAANKKNLIATPLEGDGLIETPKQFAV